MKKQLVIWREHKSDPVIAGFSHRPEYHIFFQKCMEIFELRFADKYIGQGKFVNVSKYKDGRIIPAEDEFQADVIYQMTRVTPDKFDNAVKIVDSVEFRNWVWDKWQHYQFLSEYMQPTFLLGNIQDYKNAVEQIKTSKLILKPRFGKQGAGIKVLSKGEIPDFDPQILAARGYILQEFADTQAGVANIVKGQHDIKLITIDDKIFASLRTPLTGLEVCTFRSPYSEIPLTKLPQEFLDLHAKIRDQINAKFPGQIYSIDLAMTPRGPILFEVNGYTAFPYIHFEYANAFFEALIAKLLN